MIRLDSGNVPGRLAESLSVTILSGRNNEVRYQSETRLKAILGITYYWDTDSYSRLLLPE